MGLGTTYLFVFTSFLYAFDEDVKVVDDFVDPALVVPLLDGLVTQFGHDANTATNHGSLQREEDIMSSENFVYVYCIHSLLSNQITQALASHGLEQWFQIAKTRPK